MNTTLIARPVWPVLRRIAPLLSEAGYRPEIAPSWSGLVDARLSLSTVSGVFLGEGGDVSPEMDLLRRFRERAGSAGVPVVLVGGMNALRRADRFRGAGADLVVPADMPAATLVEIALPLLRYGSLCQSLLSDNRGLKEQALRDELTGLPNRRHFSLDLARNLEMVRRTGRPLSCILVDIDDLRKLNETHGTSVGDTAIRQFATALDRGKRAYDSVARLGGDEFAWLLVDTDRAQALAAAERAHRIVNEIPLGASEAAAVRVTATFGVSTVVSGVDLTADDLVGNADRALYWGKESGKNAVRFYPQGKGHDDATADTHLS